LFFVLAPQILSTAPASKLPLSSSENIKFSFTNLEKSQSQLQKQTSTSVESPSSTSNITSQCDNKPSIFGNFNDTSSTSIFRSSTSLKDTNTPIFGDGASLKPSTNTNSGFSFPSFGNITATTTSSTGFRFSTPATTTANASSIFSFQSTAAASANKPFFSNVPKFSFSDIAKQTSSNDKPTSNCTEQRGMNVNLNFFILFICFLSLCWSRFTYIWYKFSNNRK
jgi:hypothetical protein